MSLTSQVSMRMVADVVGANDMGSPQAHLELSASRSYADGSGDGQAAKVFSDRRQLAASANEDLDLSGALSNALGETTVFAKVKALMIRALDTNVNNVEVGGAAATQFTGFFKAVNDVIVLKPGASMMLQAPLGGWTVGAGASDFLRFTNSGGGSAVDFDVMIIGD
jgi:hypothetical protein